jgi:predicted phosphodiesterase
MPPPSIDTSPKSLLFGRRMRIAVMADIHANLEAFDAVLRDARDCGCTQHAFAGDFVGYCADPKECLDIVRLMNAQCVKGNHDEYCSNDLPLDGFNPKAARAVMWTRNQLTADDRQWLRNLPYVCKTEDFTIVHATLNAPERWGYVFDKLAAQPHFGKQETPICFFGHTHVPVAFIRDTVVRGGTYIKFKIEKGKQYFINVGSVGQSRDNNPKAAYVIYDLDQRSIELRRVAYDMETTRRKIREAGLDV